MGCGDVQYIGHSLTIPASATVIRVRYGTHYKGFGPCYYVLYHCGSYAISYGDEGVEHCCRTGKKIYRKKTLYMTRNECDEFMDRVKGEEVKITRPDTHSTTRCVIEIPKPKPKKPWYSALLKVFKSSRNLCVIFLLLFFTIFITTPAYSNPAIIWYMKKQEEKKAKEAKELQKKKEVIKRPKKDDAKKKLPLKKDTVIYYTI